MESLQRRASVFEQVEPARPEVPAAGPIALGHAAIGRAMGHHGELFQGAVRDRNGRLHRALSSLPCGGLSAEATFYLDEKAPLTVNPGWKTKARLAAQLALKWAHKPDVGGRLEVRSDIPPGWGFGSSTSDVTATLRAVFAALRMDVGPCVIARLAVQAETACDSTMFNHSAVLFAHREGEVLEDLGGQLPEYEVLGFNTDPSGTGIDTLEFSPARYSPKELNTFCDLIELLRRSVQTQDLHLLGHVATTCARINQSYLPKPQFERIEAVMNRVGAAGIQVAHSGTVVGMLFDPNDVATPGRVTQARREISELGFPQIWRFSTRQTDPLVLA